MKNSSLKLNPITSAIAACLIAATTSPVIASNEATPMSEVVVTATRTAKSVCAVPATVSVVTAKDIQEQPSESLADLVKDVPGVEVTNNNGIKNISIRGENLIVCLS